MLESTEYVEQAYLFQLLRERIVEQIPLQELLEQVQAELLATTKLPMAVDFLLTELRHSGIISPAMQRLRHYFSSFQVFLVIEAESESGRFDMRVALQVMEREAKFRSQNPTAQASFMFQFETLCRNSLNYDRGLQAIAEDPIYDEPWRNWIRHVRNQVGFVDLADMIFLRSEEYLRLLEQQGGDRGSKPLPLFGAKEGRIAAANRRRDPVYFFSALQRHLDYPAVPRPIPPDNRRELMAQLTRRMERMETRMKLLEQETRGGIDLTKFFGPPPP